MGRKLADKVGLILRFDEALRRQLERAAKAHNRSMNAEIVQRLKASFEWEGLEAFLAERLEAAAEKGADRALDKITSSDPAISRLDKITSSGTVITSSDEEIADRPRFLSPPKEGDR